MEFRCSSRMHFISTKDYIEVKCHSKRCGAGGGVIVLHRFNKTTGRMTDTIRLQDPAKYLAGKEESNAIDHHPAAVRSA